eukprot:scaffold12852_cov49-Attheya_sp.AAC.3
MIASVNNCSSPLTEFSICRKIFHVESSAQDLRGLVVASFKTQLLIALPPWRYDGDRLIICCLHLLTCEHCGEATSGAAKEDG